MTAQSSAINVTGDGVVVATPCTYRGISIANGTDAANTVTLYDNASSASGTVIAVFELAASGSAGASAGENVPDGVRCVNGLFLDSTGTLTGSVRIG